MVPTGGTNAVDHHAIGPFGAGDRCDTYSCTEGFVVNTA